MKHIAVIDIGKTNAKLALVDLAQRAEIAVLTRPNPAIQTGPYPHFDTDGIWDFLCAGLAEFQSRHGIDGISITTHGACAALLTADGTLATPVLDYEHRGPDDTRAAYDLLRPDFAETGSARLPMGLNLGAQLFWLFEQDASLKARTSKIVTWPQYWGFRLTGNLASDLCSIGCHTDLWNPYLATWSSLVDRLRLEDIMAPPQKPSQILGVLLPELQSRLGLLAVPVLTGIHDSNASLVPYLTEPAPFSVVSTGTWVIAMAMGGKSVPLDPSRDVLVNVNALGHAVPSARFMGGREYELISQGHAPSATQTDASRVLARSLMLLPSVVQGSGPFPRLQMHWTDSSRDDAESEVALGYYLALMTAECLESIGAQGPIRIEGPFSVNPWYCSMLNAATGRETRTSTARTGTAIGAALLFLPQTAEPAPQTPPPPTPSGGLKAYAQKWAALVKSRAPTHP